MFIYCSIISANDSIVEDKKISIDYVNYYFFSKNLDFNENISYKKYISEFTANESSNSDKKDAINQYYSSNINELKKFQYKSIFYKKFIDLNIQKKLNEKNILLTKVENNTYKEDIKSEEDLSFEIEKQADLATQKFIAYQLTKINGYPNFIVDFINYTFQIKKYNAFTQQVFDLKINNINDPFLFTKINEIKLKSINLFSHYNPKTKDFKIVKENIIKFEKMGIENNLLIIQNQEIENPDTAKLIEKNQGKIEKISQDLSNQNSDILLKSMEFFKKIE